MALLLRSSTVWIVFLMSFSCQTTEDNWHGQRVSEKQPQKQENRSLDRLKLLQQQQERHRDRFFPINALFQAKHFEGFSGDDRFWHLGTQVLFPFPVR